MWNIGIINESRNDDKRCPLIPIHVKEILNTYSDVIISVQPSKHRCYSDQEYQENGAIIKENLNECSWINVWNFM